MATIWKRWLSFAARTGEVRTKVLDADKRLLLLESNLTTRNLKPGSLLSDHEDNLVAIGFSAFNYHFGIALKRNFNIDDILMKPNNSLEQQKLFSSIFKDQPDGNKRGIITNAWITQCPAIDMLCPIGLGQSMFFVSPENSVTFQNVTKDINVDHLKKSQFEYRMFSHSNKLGTKYNYLEGLEDEDEDLGYYLKSYMLCNEAEHFRDINTGHALLLLGNLERFNFIWNRARKLAWKNYLHMSKFKMTEDKLREHPIFGKGKDRTEMRHFYSSLIQRAAYLKNNSSLTVLHNVNMKPMMYKHSEAILNMSLDDLLRHGEVKIKEYQRLLAVKNALEKAGKPFLCLEAAAKLGIELNCMDGSNGIQSLISHSEEIKSLSDGHIMCLPSNSDGPVLDAKNSLTRIGIGTNIKQFRDIRPKELAAAVGALRLQYLTLLDHPSSNTSKEVDLWSELFSYSTRVPLKKQIEVGKAIKQNKVQDQQDLISLLNS